MEEPKNIIVRDLITITNPIRHLGKSLSGLTKHPIATIFYFISYGVILFALQKLMGWIIGLIVSIIVLTIFYQSFNKILDE